jgi:hypothetical protein
MTVARRVCSATGKKHENINSETRHGSTSHEKATLKHESGTLKHTRHEGCYLVCLRIRVGLDGSSSSRQGTALHHTRLQRLNSTQQHTHRLVLPFSPCVLMKGVNHLPRVACCAFDYQHSTATTTTNTTTILLRLLISRVWHVYQIVPRGAVATPESSNMADVVTLSKMPPVSGIVQHGKPSKLQTKLSCKPS